MDYQQPQQNNGTIFVFIGIIILIIATIVIFMILDGKVDDYQDNQTIEDVYYHITIQAKDSNDKQVYDVKYTVKTTDFNIIEEGILRHNVLEKFSSKDPNATYILEVEGTDIYENSIMCYSNQSICTVLVDIKGKTTMDIAELSGYDYLLIEVKDGIIKQPILCFDWKNLVDVDIEGMQLISVPSFYADQRLYEKCYRWDEDLKPGLYSKDIYHEKTNMNIEGESLWYSVTLIDECRNSYQFGCIEDISRKVVK